MAQLPRGIAPELLISQVRNTMPYLFDSASTGFPPAQFVRQLADPLPELSHFEYFRLCLSAHYLTCATPVPTDVDNQIRQKLWPRELDLATALEMTDLVLESQKWDFSMVSARVTHGLSGHQGEWFTVAAGAYGALARFTALEAKKKREQVFAAIADEVKRHSDVFGRLWNENEGLEALKASAAIAHNLGDLDRVMDMWELGGTDPLRLGFYKLGVHPFDTGRKLRYLGRLWVAGELYKSTIQESSMAAENHRHFALRKPRALRRRREYLIPTGPFFDDWGEKVAEGLSSAPEDLREVVEHLKQGWSRLAGTVGYGRALKGILERVPELESEVVSELSKPQRQLFKQSQDSFEKNWADEAVRLLDEIPGKAK